MLLALCLAGAATAAAAQADGRPFPEEDAQLRSEHFASLDANGDRALSRGEFARYPDLQGRFEAMDRDKDGTLSGLEFASAMSDDALRRERAETLR